MKLMRLFILVCCITLLSGCASFGDNRRCEIRGKPFQGLYPLIKDSANTTKVMMVHGMSKNEPGYSTQLREGLAKKMGLNRISNTTYLLDDPVTPPLRYRAPRSFLSFLQH